MKIKLNKILRTKKARIGILIILVLLGLLAALFSLFAVIQSTSDNSVLIPSTQYQNPLTGEASNKETETSNTSTISPQKNIIKTPGPEESATLQEIERIRAEQAKSSLCGNLNSQYWPQYQYTRDVTAQNVYDSTNAQIESDYHNGNISLAEKGNLLNAALDTKRASVAVALNTYNAKMINAGCASYAM